MMRPCPQCGSEMKKSEEYYKYPVRTSWDRGAAPFNPGWNYVKPLAGTHLIPPQPKFIVWRCDADSLTIEERVRAD